MFADKCRSQMMAESSDDEIAVEEVARLYGQKVADSLEKYCRTQRKSAYEVVNDATEGGSGMTQWDWFCTWSKRKNGVDVDDRFSDYDYDSDLERSARDRDEDEED